MSETTALNRLGDVILWCGTTILAICLVAGAASEYWYIVGTKPNWMKVAVEDIKKPELPAEAASRPHGYASEIESELLGAQKTRWVTEAEAGFEFPRQHEEIYQMFAALFAAVGLLSWLFLASVAYIFNGRTPVAVLKGWLLFR